MKVETSLKHILVSQTRQKIINTLFYFPKEIYYVRQLVRLLDEEINSVRRELENLKKANIIESEWRGNRLYYWANKQSAIYPELLILANKSTGLGNKLQFKNNNLGQIKLLMYSYKFICSEKKKQDDIDLIIVGDVSYKEVDNNIKQEEEIRGHEINYMIMDKQEFQLRKQKRDQFIVDFFLDCPVVIIGNPQDVSSL